MIEQEEDKEVVTVFDLSQSDSSSSVEVLSKRAYDQQNLQEIDYVEIESSQSQDSWALNQDEMQEFLDINKSESSSQIPIHEIELEQFLKKSSPSQKDADVVPQTQLPLKRVHSEESELDYFDYDESANDGLKRQKTSAE